MDDSLSNSHLEPNLDKNAASYFNSFERVITFKQLAHDQCFNDTIENSRMSPPIGRFGSVKSTLCWANLIISIPFL